MHYLHRFTPPANIVAYLKQCIKNKKPCSLIRIVDGETRILGYDVFFPKKDLPAWLRYAGVDNPSKVLKNALLQSMKEADFVGLPTQDGFFFRPLAEKILDYYKINPKNICSAEINGYLVQKGILEELVGGVRTLLLGRTIGKIIPYFKKMGARIVAVDTVEGVNDISRVVKAIPKFPQFDLVLLSAGIPTKIIAPRVAKYYGKVAVDLGHVPEMILYPNRRYLDTINDWLRTHTR